MKWLISITFLKRNIGALIVKMNMNTKTSKSIGAVQPATKAFIFMPEKQLMKMKGHL